MTPAVASTVVLALLLMPGTASGQAVKWTADDAVGRALAREDIETIVEHRVASERAKAADETTFPTPTLGLSHEQVFGSSDVSYLELTATVEQTLDFSGWREGVQRASEHSAAARQAEMEAWRLEVATQVRLAYWGVRYHQERVARLEHWIGKLKQGVEAVEARKAQGDASRYDVQRIARELETARAERSAERARLTEAWAELAAWVPWEERPTLTGTLPPDAPESTDEAVALPELEKLEQEAQASEVAQSAWGTPFWRDWTLSAGYRFSHVSAADGHGLVVGLSIPLTFWNTDAPRVERLRSDASASRSELRLQRSLAERSADAARTRLDETLDALSSLPAPERDAELTELAELAYRAGEAELIEFMDAYSSETALELARVDLQWQARRAAIEFARRRGRGIPE